MTPGFVRNSKFALPGKRTRRAGEVRSHETVLALIPARGGSKGIPRKNLSRLAGKPLVAYAIEAALRARTIQRVIVSTDDPEIAAAARRYGAEVPFQRPARLAGDLTPDWPVFRHALEWLASHEGYYPDLVVHVRPTAPLRRVEHLDAAVRLLQAHPGADSVRWVSPAGQHPLKMWRIIRRRLVPWASPNGVREPYNLPRQRLEMVYAHNGVVDAVWARTILQQRSMTGRRILPLITEPEASLDLDTPHDLQVAEQLLRQWKGTT